MDGYDTPILPLIVTVLLAPIVLSYYWNISLVALIAKQCRCCCQPKHLVTTSTFNLIDAIAIAKNTTNIFGSRTIRSIHVRGSQTLTTEPIVIDFGPLTIQGESTDVIATHGISIVRGAEVHIKHLRIHGNTFSDNIMDGKGISILDRHSLLHLSACVVENCHSSGIVARRGGSFILESCHIRSNHGSGIVVGDSISNGNIKNCHIKRNVNSGVYVYHGGTCTVHGESTEIEKNQVDLRARGGTIELYVDELSCTRRVEENGMIV
jgi:hypothetical protein